MRDYLHGLIRREGFYPGTLGIFVNPFFIARLGLKAAMVEHSTFLTGRLLDVGCGTKPYKPLFNVSEYVGLDIDSQASRQRSIADCFYDGKNFPCDNESFDSILCNQVLEHVFNPDEFLAEIYRVLRPGGRLLLTVPFVWDEHEQPYDYARYSSFGLKAIIEKRGFKIISQKKIGDDVSVLFQLANGYLFKVMSGKPRLWRILSSVLLIAPMTALGLVLGKLLPSNPDLYLDNVLLAEKRS